MDRPPPDPKKLLDEWMEWERGEATPGRVMANLKTAGLRDLLEQLTEALATAGAPVTVTTSHPAAEKGPDADSESTWTPTV
jgi:hypothetical protein